MGGVPVVLSSHVLAELERVADYLIVLSRGQVQMAGEVDDLWPFQWIEGGWLLVLSALLIAASVWLIRRRAA